ncbi:DNA-binding winged helix-turn-helix (wHTH) domain-containing protein [Kosakonia arachidis]|uniref:DNA-binding winged helix-turn-helix (WHTH) domain-containing protein n=1 Tax=Kosakonia arachidis TaxID=551989 RepID=A0A1I7DXH2_9ENTR|nr:winged helix-turn-helix domain-containing protein [Kosakonia arachidis]SFU16371.1 DNA-binding winged helix-turn-helix (wHTH) domain-containing protein [Kosakonia arachidis]
MNSHIYRINNEVDFNIAERTLCRCDMYQPSALLTKPASKCLELLITKKPGEIVKHNELYDYAWEKRTRETSPNTLYQTIFQTRRIIATTFNTKEQFILTLPREGFYFNPAVTIEPLKYKAKPPENCHARNLKLALHATNHESEIHARLNTLQQILLDVCDKVNFIEKLTRTKHGNKMSTG